MSIQPTGYNLPSFANVTVHNSFSYELQTQPVTTESALFWAKLGQGPVGRTIQTDCYEGFTGRLHEVMHHRPHQTEY